MYWLKTEFQSNQNEFTYHHVYLDLPQNLSNNGYYDLEGSIGEININETMQTKYYEYGFLYDFLHIRNIDSVKSKIIHL